MSRMLTTPLKSALRQVCGDHVGGVGSPMAVRRFGTGRLRDEGRGAVVEGGRGATSSRHRRRVCSPTIRAGLAYQEWAPDQSDYVDCPEAESRGVATMLLSGDSTSARGADGPAQQGLDLGDAPDGGPDSCRLVHPSHGAPGWDDLIQEGARVPPPSCRGSALRGGGGLDRCARPRGDRGCRLLRRGGGASCSWTWWCRRGDRRGRAGQAGPCCRADDAVGLQSIGLLERHHGRLCLGAELAVGVDLESVRRRAAFGSGSRRARCHRASRCRWGC